MNKYPTHQPLDEFESELRGLNPRAPKLDLDSALDHSAIDAEQPTHESVRKLNLVTWMASSWACGATIGAAVMFVLLSSSSPRETIVDLTNSNTTGIDSPFAQGSNPSSDLAQNQTTVQSNKSFDWLDRIQSLPAGSLGVGSSLLISQSDFAVSTSVPVEADDSYVGNVVEQLVDRSESKNQRQLLREMLGRPKQIF